MLALAPKVEQALARSTCQPVLYAEFVTELQDSLYYKKSDWDANTMVTAGPGTISTTGAALTCSVAHGLVLGDYVKLTSGAQSGQIRRVIAVPTTTTATLDSAYSADQSNVTWSKQNQFRTMLTKEDDNGLDSDSAWIQMLYPAQAGDPIQNAVGFNISAASADTPDTMLGPFIRFPFQTFRINTGEQAKYQITGIKLRLKKSSSTPNGLTITPFLMKGIPGSDNLGGQLNADDTRNGILVNVETINASSIQTDSLTTSFAEYTFTFSQTIEISKDQQYTIFLGGLVGQIGQIFWESYYSRDLAPREFSGNVNYTAFGENRVQLEMFNNPKRELYLKVLIPAYSYDGITTNYRDVKHDLGSIPGENGYFDFDYRTPGDSVVIFHAWASSDPTFVTDVTDLGTVVDGQEITVRKRYYKIRTSFSSASLLYTAAVHKTNVVFPKTVHRYSTAPIDDLPNTLPLIKSIPSIPIRLDLKSYIASTQTWTIEIIDPNFYASIMAQEVNFKNIPVELRIGVTDTPITSKYDMAPYGAGLVTDYGFSEGILKIEVQDRSKEFSIKLPKAKIGLSDQVIPPAALDYTGKHMVDVYDDLRYTQIRTPRRYKDAASFSAIKTALTADYITDRTIEGDKPEEARDLVKELLEVMGCYIFWGEDGKEKLIQYPRSGNALATWDDNDFLIGTEQPMGIDDTIINDCIVQHNWDEPAGKYLGYAGYVDGPSQRDWAPGAGIADYDRTIKSKWIGSPQYRGDWIARTVAERVVRHSKDGLIPLKGQTTLKWWKVQVGDFIDIKTRAFLRKGQRGTMNNPQKFMVTSKHPDFERGIISWELIEARDLNRPPKVNTIGDPFSATPSSGTPPFTVNFDATGKWTDPDGDAITYEWDFDYDGRNFQVDATGITASHQYTSENIGRKTPAIRVTDSKGASSIGTKVIRVLANPTAIISIITQTNPGQPLNAILSGTSSFSSTSEIVKLEWDLTYDGANFQPDVIGVQVQISMPYKTTLIALKVTDQDELSHIATLTLTGKTLAPPQVTNFLVEQYQNDLLFSWDPNPDIDLYGYEIRRFNGSGGTWATALDDVVTEILTNSVKLPSPRPSTYTYFIKAIDTTGNYSATATSVQVEILDPRNRNVVKTHNEKTSSWPGTETNMTYVVANDNYILSSQTTLGDLPASGETLGSLPFPGSTLGGLGTLVPEGQYELPAIDLGAILEPVQVDLNVDATFTNIDNVTIIKEIRIAQNDSGTPTWGSWGPIKGGDLKFRQIQARVKLRQIYNEQITLNNIILTLDTPDIIQEFRDQAVASGGTSFTFAKRFNMLSPDTPKLSFTVQNATGPVFVERTAISATGFTIKLRNNSWTDIGGGAERVDIIAIGW